MDWDKIKLSLWSAVGGAIILAIVGFKWGGWVTGGAARAMAEETAAEAVVSRLTPMCIAQFKQDPEKDQRLKELKKKDFWDSRKYVEDQGWATMLGEKEPDKLVAEECADQLMQI